MPQMMLRWNFMGNIHCRNLFARWALARLYLILVVVPLLLVLGTLSFGEAHFGQPARRMLPGFDALTTSAPFDLAVLCMQVVLIVGVARIVGAAIERLGQPRVIGEIIGGILLGPTVFGAAAPRLFATVFPQASLGFLNAIAQFGVLLFMFLLGLELDLPQLRGQAHVALVASHASISVPFLLGVLLSLVLYTTFAPVGVTFTAFALFVGAALSVTAFPVLARVLRDRHMSGTPLAGIAIACAAVDDVTAWCILAVSSAVATAGSIAGLRTTLIGSVVYVLVMLTLGRPLLRWLARRAARDDEAEGECDNDGSFTAAAIVVGFTSAWVTESLGIHGVFGAFFAGAIMPRDVLVARALTHRLRSVLAIPLLPLFFAFTGLRTSLTLISTSEAILFCALVFLVAVLGKLGGSAVAAHASGMTWRDALSLGALMNTRGLMELVILNVGLDVGVLSPALFAIMIVMALSTTALTGPLLDRVQLWQR